MDLPCESREYIHFRSEILENGSSAVRLFNPSSLNVPPDQMVGQCEPLVGGQGRVSQVDGGTFRGPGPDQASPNLIQHRYKCCPSHSTGSIGNIPVRLGYLESQSQGGNKHLHPHQHPHHGPCDGFVDQTEISP